MVLVRAKGPVTCVRGMDFEAGERRGRGKTD